MSILPHSVTYEDLERARDVTSDRVELIDGELFVTPAPSLGHQDILGLLFVLLRRAIADSGVGRVYLAPVDVRLADSTILQPDLVVVLADRLSILTPAKIAGTPSLVVEIVSPSTRVHDRIAKRAIYARHSIPEYWLVDPDARAITVFSQPLEGHYRAETVGTEKLLSATIPGLSVDLETLFAAIPEF